MGGEGRIRPAVPHLIPQEEGVTVDGRRGLLILLSLPERSLSGLGVKRRRVGVSGGWIKGERRLCET